MPDPPQDEDKLNRFLAKMPGKKMYQLLIMTKTDSEIV